MGLEDREYLRDSDYEPPVRRGGRAWSMCAMLIAANVVVFLLQLLTASTAGESAVEELLILNVDDFFGRVQVWRILTYAFCHSRAELFHIVFNMMTLYVAAQLVLTVLQEREFLWVYLFGAIFAGLTSLIFYAFQDPGAQILGASGAVLTALTLAAIYHPRQKLLLMGILPLEMRWLLALFIAYDLMPLLSGAQTGTAHSAHLGGVAFGFLYHKAGFNFTRFFAGMQQNSRVRRARRNLKVFSPDNDSRLGAEVDRILSKISESGEASLTASERRTLAKASRELRRKNGG